MSFLPSLFSREVKIHDSFLGIDLGTSVVKVAAFSLGEDGVTLVGYGSFSFKEISLRNALLTNPKLVTDALNQAIKEATVGMKKLPKEVVVGLSGEEILGVSCQVRLKRGIHYTKPITAGEINQLNAQCEKVAWAEAHEAFSMNLGLETVAFDALNSKINTMTIDDQAVMEILGKTGRNVTLTQFFSYALSSYLELVQGVLRKLGLKLVTVTSLNYALTEALALGNVNELNAILVDVGHLSTEVGLIYGRNLTYLRSFPLGLNSVSKSLVARCQISLEEAEEMVQSLIKDPYQKTEDCPVKQIASNVAKMWVSGLSVLLEDCTHVRLFPGRIILTGGGAYLPQFKEVLISHSFPRDFPFETHPKIDVLESPEVRGVYSPSVIIESPQKFGVVSLGLVGLQIKEKM